MVYGKTGTTGRTTLGSFGWEGMAESVSGSSNPILSISVQNILVRTNRSYPMCTNWGEITREMPRYREISIMVRASGSCGTP